MESVKFTIMKFDTKLVDIELDCTHKNLINYFIYKECPHLIKVCICDFDSKTIVYGALINWLEKRTIPYERVNRDYLIKKVYKINPNFATLFSLLSIDHGVSVLDDFWIKFSNEDIRYADVRVKY